MLDELLHYAHDYVRVLLFDGGACNQVLRSIIHGQMDNSFRRKVVDLKYFSKLSYSECPGMQDLPRFPMKTCFVDKTEQIFALQGPSHALKNGASQVCSESKVVFFGHFMCDFSGALQNDLPLPAYSRKDAMSDRLCSLLSHPLFLIHSDATWICLVLFQSISLCLCHPVVSFAFFE